MYADLTFGAATHPGNVRDLNEDDLLACPPVFVVADGMGGHRAGEVASRIVVTSLAELSRGGEVTVESVERCIERCQQRIVALDDGSGRAPGSTLVAGIQVRVDGHRYWLIINVGDSRAYILHGDRFEQVTHDHTIVQELVDSGAISPAEAAFHPDRHVITRALGTGGRVEADWSFVPIADGSTLLLCSDGVTNELDDRSLESILRTSAGPTAAAQLIVDSAVWRGGRDNATAIVVSATESRVIEDTVVVSRIVEDTMSRAGAR